MIRKLGMPLRSVTRPRVLAVAGFLAGAVLVGGLADRWLYHWSVDFGRRTEESLREFYRLFRSLGSLPTWLAVAAAFALFDGRRLDGALRRRLARAELVLVSVLSAGLVANVLKEVVRRARPRNTEGAYVFHPPWGEVASVSGFGMPSGEASVCFAGVFALCRLVPSGWPVWLLLGCGCAFYRMVLGAHFLSDVLVGAAVGWVGVEIARRVGRGLESFASERGGARAPSLREVTATGAAFVAGLAVWNVTEGWRPAVAADVPGLYETFEPSRRDVTFFFEPDGTYRSIETFTRGAPRLVTREGTWSFDDALLRLDGSEPVPLLVAGGQLRLGDHDGALILKRKSSGRSADWTLAEHAVPGEADGRSPAAGADTAGAVVAEAPHTRATPVANESVVARPPAAGAFPAD